MTAACVLEATITAGCDGCSDVPPTVYRSFPCDQGCTSLGCKTVYTVVTASGSACESSSHYPCQIVFLPLAKDADIFAGSVAATQTQDDAGVETATSTVTETVVVSPTLTTQPDTSAASPTTAQADTDAASSVSTQTDTAVATLTTTTTIDAGAESSTTAQGDSIKTSEVSKAVASTAGAARLVARFLLS